MHAFKVSCETFKSSTKQSTCESKFVEMKLVFVAVALLIGFSAVNGKTVYITSYQLSLLCLSNN